MSELEKWRRMTHPLTLADYGESVCLERLREEAPDVFAKEVEPFLPQDLINMIAGEVR